MSGHGGRRHGGERAGDGRGGGHGHRPGHDRLGNPEDFAAYLAKLDDPARLEWQRPDEVVAALGLGPGGLAADVGAGPGIFTLRMARAVGPSGRVHAIDAEPRMLELLRGRAAAAGLANVHPHLAAGGVPVLPEPVDVVLVVNTFHHFPDGPGTLRSLAGRLRPGGRLVNLDFQAGELPVGPPAEAKVSREEFLSAAAAAGLAVAGERTFLPYQYFLVLVPR